MTREKSLILAMLVLLLILFLSAIHPYDRTTWFMEVAPIFIALPIMIASCRRFPLTTLLYVLIFIPALFLDMFGDPATNPKGWRQSTLDESGATIRYGIGQPLPQIEGGLPFLRATNVKRGVISRTGLVYIDPNANPMKRNPPLKHTDILVVRSGAYTGDIAQVGREFEGAIAGYDLVLSPGNEHLSEFLATYLLLPHVQNGYMAAHKIRAAQPHLNATQLGGIVIPIPPLKNQFVFVQNVDSVRSIQSQQSAATAKARATFDALLAQVFS